MEEDNIIVKWAQEDVETSYNLLNNNFNTVICTSSYNKSKQTHNNFYFQRHTSTPKNGKG